MTVLDNINLAGASLAYTIARINARAPALISFIARMSTIQDQPAQADRNVN